MAGLYRRRIRPVLKGAKSWLLPNQERKATGGTNDPGYCYSVWLRHLVLAAQNGLTKMPDTVAELGPGDSLGIGLAALVGGAGQYSAFDIVEFATRERNIEAFDQITEYYRYRRAILEPEDNPKIRPLLDSWEFPDCFAQLGDLDHALDDMRIKQLRAALANLRTNDPPGSPIRYICPWNDAKVLKPESQDFVLAQAVLEHVEDVPGTYIAVANWLRPGGLFSQTIGLDSHGLVPDWNGHWAFGPLAWRVLRGRWAYLINRVPLSEHIRHLSEAGFEIVDVIRYTDTTGLPAEKLAEPFRSMPQDDIVTSSAYVLARKP